MTTAIIGGGAAGIFAAIQLKQAVPQHEVIVYEAASKVLAKVAITGGGRCNLTNSFADIQHLHLAYPRGERLLKSAFKAFDHEDTYEWFESHGVKLTTQEDNCVFPLSQQSGEIIDTLLNMCKQLDVVIRTKHRVNKIYGRDNSGQFTISFEGNTPNARPENIIVTTGGSPQQKGLNFLSELPLKYVEPVPSLFSFNLSDKAVKELMGTVVENAVASLPGTKMKSQGALLITHWGMSGPAILKLSSFAARWMAEHNYQARLSVNWLGEIKEAEVSEYINEIICTQGQKQLSTVRPYNLPSRLWSHILSKSDLPETKRWAELGRKGINRLASRLTNDEYDITGKNKFKDEFVTCGGVSLECIDRNTLECKTCEGLYFAGEVTDVDAITGGFNLQAAWTMGFVAAHSIAKRYNQ